MKRLSLVLAADLAYLICGCSDAGFLGGTEDIAARSIHESDEASGEDEGNSLDITPEEGGETAEGEDGAVEDGEDGGESGDQDDEDAEASEDAGELNVDDDEFVPTTPNEKKIAKCLSDWGNTPFTGSAAKNFRVLKALGGGVGNKKVEDTRQTDEPELVLVSVKSLGVGNFKLRLLNPNGWYCLDVTSLGVGNKDIEVHCQAMVGSSSVTTLGVGNSSTERVGC